MMIETFLLDFSSKIRDRMAVPAYISEKSRKGPIFKASNQSLGYS